MQDQVKIGIDLPLRKHLLLLGWPKVPGRKEKKNVSTEEVGEGRGKKTIAINWPQSCKNYETT